MTKLLFSFIAALIFFIVSLFFLSDYGISWDEATHFKRGQGYLHFFLTGEADYSNLSTPRKSFFQDSIFDGKFYMQLLSSGGHPPLNGLLASLSNYFFYQQLGWLGDVASYHLFNILSATLLVFIVTLFSSEILGLLPASVVFLSLITYPLFWAESKFNIKDPPEAAFILATIYSFVKSVEKKSSRWLLASIIFFTLGLGTKLNIAFLPLVVVPYLLLRFSNRIFSPKYIIKQIPKSYLFVLLSGPFITVTVIYLTWPTLWQKFPQYLLSVLYYYKNIGTGLYFQPSYFYFFGFNTYPIQHILYTTPPLTLILVVLGLIFATINLRKFRFVFVLWILLFLIPILRVTVPGSSIYGGVRQIMEFLPGLALISGIGVWALAKFIKPRFVPYFWSLIFLLFLYPIFVLYKLHPNQNLYFNSLIGGLRGAKTSNFPSWGNSFGNAYFQGVKWLNQNATTNAKLTLLQGELQNAYPPDIRSDINFTKQAWSGFERKGEYIMELNFNDTATGFHYAWEYVNKFLEPVYELKVDEVTILKVWKNDLEHTKTGQQLKNKQYFGDLKISSLKNVVLLELNEENILARADLIFEPKNLCPSIKSGIVETSLDNQTWSREWDPIPFPQIKYQDNLDKGSISYHFPGRSAKYIRFSLTNSEGCTLPTPKVYILQKNNG